MQLTVRALLPLLLTAVPLVLMTVTPAFGVPAFGWLTLLLALLLADLRLSPRPGDWEVRRRHDERLSLAAWNPVTVTVSLRGGRRPVRLWLRDEPPPTFGIAESERILAGVLVPGEDLRLVYRLRPPRRGDYRFGDLNLRWESSLRLFRRQARFPAAEAVKVYPNLADVRKYDLLLRQNRLWELGLRNARLLGSGNEFERLRDYGPDDEYRRINWKATARRGKPIAVEYETERSQNLMAVLDVGRMMRSPVGDVAKLDYAINAVLLLAYVAVQKGDKLGLLTFADRPGLWLTPRGGKGQFLRMLEALYRVDGQPVEPDYTAAFSYLAAKQARRSLVLLFTDLTGSTGAEALVAGLIRLGRQHLPLLVTIADPTVQRLARAAVVDSRSLYERTVAAQLLDERRLTLDRLRAQGVATLDVPADELSVAVIDKYLELKARLRL